MTAVPVALSAVLRGGLAVVVIVLGTALVSVTSVWWHGVDESGNGGYWLSFMLALTAGTGALVWLYGLQPSKPATVLIVLGCLAMCVVFLTGAEAVHDLTLRRAGVDTDAVVDRVWTTESRPGPSYHCTLRRTDGTPIPRELTPDCEGFDAGETLAIVVDPDGRFAPRAGRKSGLDTTGWSGVAGTAGLIVLIVIAIGSPPRRSKQGKAGPVKAA
jgi:hypothetical protein